MHRFQPTQISREPRPCPNKAERDVERAKTARLRVLRLAKESADSETKQVPRASCRAACGAGGDTPVIYVCRAAFAAVTSTGTSSARDSTPAVRRHSPTARPPFQNLRNSAGISPGQSYAVQRGDRCTSGGLLTFNSSERRSAFMTADPGPKYREFRDDAPTPTSLARLARVMRRGML
jgi:hypothetical protein